MKVDPAVSDGKVDGSAVDDGQSAAPESVSAEAYKRLLNQRKADQARAKAAEEELNRIKAEREAEETKRLAEANEFKKLYEAEQGKNKQLETKLSEMTISQVTREKTSALSRELGISKAEFLKLANLSGIQMTEDGTVDAESVKRVADEFRKAYPELVPAKSGVTLPNGAPKDAGPKPPKRISDMSTAELKEFYKQQRLAGKM